MQQQCGCVVGADYPARIVDHDAASKELMQRIKAAYDQHHRLQQQQQSKGAGGAVVEQEGEGEGEAEEGPVGPNRGGSGAVGRNHGGATGAPAAPAASHNKKKRAPSGTSSAPAKSRKMTDFLTDRK